MTIIYYATQKWLVGSISNIRTQRRVTGYYISIEDWFILVIRSELFVISICIDL